MKTEQNFSMDELAAMLVEEIMAEPILRRDTLLPKIKVWLKGMVDLKNVPKNYNAYESKKKQAIRLRTIEQKDAEIKFWLAIVRNLDKDNIEQHYKDQEQMLRDKGFLNHM